MSVPTSERKTSTLQYIETARKLAREVLSFCNRLPKRLWPRLANPLCNHATEALYNVQAANRIYVKTDADYDRRRGHLQEAMGHIDHVATLLDIAYDTIENPNDNVFGEFAERIEKERELIGGVMRKDQRARG